MKIPYFCCIGAELKRYAKDFDFMNQVYLYKVPTDDSIEEVLAEDYFKAISDSVLQDDLVYIYEASAETLHSCRFDKQNGHITAVPLASDETLTGAVTTIIHDNLTKNRAVISNNDGKIAVSEVTTTELGYLSGATSNIQEQLNEKAKTDLSNLTSAGKNIGNWSSNVTNCITEIPQDINLTLSSAGQLKLLAGSKLYIPNGSNVFTEKTITSDITRAAGISVQCLEVALYNKADLTFAQLFEVQLSKVCSGTTDTLAGQSQHLWYDTANNLIKYYGNDGVTNNYYAAFPLGLVTGNGSQITSIDQVFNGFGYIGSTVFVLPGVKGLMPNGRNADGSLKNTNFTVSKVSTQIITATTSKVFGISGASSDKYRGFVESETQPATLYTLWYKPSENNMYTTNTGTPSLVTRCPVAFFSFNGTIIKNINTVNTFQAVDYNDSEYIAHCSMPSNRYVDLTLGSSPYIAPADGYFTISQAATAAGQYLRIQNATNGLNTSIMSGATGTLRIFMPVSKGDSVSIATSAGGSVDTFRFVYANGSK